MKKLDPSKIELLETLEALDARRRYGRLGRFKPYPKQALFFELGATKRERALMAANRVGKSECGAVEIAYHLTGRYPANWAGKRFARPIVGWAAGETSVLVRDVQQWKLFGKPGVTAEFGTGYVPKDCILDKPSMARGVTDAFDTVHVKHFTDGVEDGVSTLTFKSYEQGRAKFQGGTVDVVWLDEEPPADVFSEALTRIAPSEEAPEGGILFGTFTPLKGVSEVMLRYRDQESPDRALVGMTIDEAEHISPAEREKIVAGYLPHEREARARGTPMMGSGRVFSSSEESISETMSPAMVPLHWAKLWGTDFGVAHPFAAALIAWDRDADVIHVVHVVRMTDSRPRDHAAAMKPIAAGVPVAWPADGAAREKSSGKELASFYKDEGLVMLPTHATWPDGGVSTEAGVVEMDDRFKTGRLKVARHLLPFFEEYRDYHRKDGQLVKIRDDILSAVRVAVMAKRFARPMAIGGKKTERRQTEAKDVDFDLW